MSENMSIDELVAVNSLLIERETRLAGLSQIESAISDILGSPYPFQDPEAEIPSLKKGKRSKAPKKRKSKANPKIRRLKDGESGYRISIIEHRALQTHDLLDFTPFQALLSKPLPTQRIQKVVTLDKNSTPVDTLFEAT